MKEKNKSKKKNVKKEDKKTQQASCRKQTKILKRKAKK